MKRVFKSKEIPKQLKIFSESFPHEQWERFRRHSRRGYKEVKAQILRDQRGLCAYCEISIKLAENEAEIDDFRVEHFFPKGETEDHGRNWHLKWQNMLGVCHGGSQKGVAGADWRYSDRKTDRTCDVPKGGKDLSDIILNPLKIPANKRLFKYLAYNGKMLVDEATCPPYYARKAKNTIKELNLNAARLKRMRLVVIQTLQDELEANLARGMELEESLDLLAELFLAPDKDGNYTAFFTTIRWYLGEAAEKFLSARCYRI